MGAWHSHTASSEKWAEKSDRIELCKPGWGVCDTSVAMHKFHARWLLCGTLTNKGPGQGSRTSAWSHLGIWAKGEGGLDCGGHTLEGVEEKGRGFGKRIWNEEKREEVTLGAEVEAWSGWCQRHRNCTLKAQGRAGITAQKLQEKLWRQRLSTEMKDRLYGGSSQALELDEFILRENTAVRRNISQ